jgi:DNA replication protein DnaC
MVDGETCTICGGMGWLRRNLPQGHPELGKLIACVCELKRRAEKRARELRELSGVSDAALQRFTFGAFEPASAVASRCDMSEVKRICEAYAAEPLRWLVLMGPYGTGKTHLAYAIVGELLRRSVPVYAASVPEMLGMIRNGFRDAQGLDAEARLQALRRVEVLVLDDWGTEKGSDWVSETMFQVLNHRYNERMATVITTNLTPAELRAREPRLASRLLDTQLSRWLVLNAGDYRQKG